MVLQTMKQPTKNNNYGICDLKPKIKIKLNMALLKLNDHESFLIHGTT
jgi:hypothetical protein